MGSWVFPGSNTSPPPPCLQQSVASCRHRRPIDQGFDRVFSHECFLVYLVAVGVYSLSVYSVFFLGRNRKKKSLLCDSVSCLQKDLPNQLPTQPCRHGWNMVQFPQACILALCLTGLLCMLIFLPFYSCEVATLLKIYLMLLDTLVDNRFLSAILIKTWMSAIDSILGHLIRTICRDKSLSH